MNTSWFMEGRSGERIDAPAVLHLQYALFVGLSISLPADPHFMCRCAHHHPPQVPINYLFNRRCHGLTDEPLLRLISDLYFRHSSLLLKNSHIHATKIPEVKI